MSTVWRLIQIKRLLASHCYTKISQEKCAKNWNYRTAVGMLTYLQSNTRPEISMAVHQTSRFCNDPMLSHEQAIKRLGRYLYHTKKEGIVYNPTKKGLEYYFDADFFVDFCKQCEAVAR